MNNEYDIEMTEVDLENETELALHIPTMEDLREVPRDKIVDVKIVEVKIATWREIINPDKIDKFKNPDERKVHVKYDFEGFTRSDSFAFFEKPTTTSLLGRFMVKYNTFPKVGMDAKAHFDEEGKASLVLAK